MPPRSTSARTPARQSHPRAAANGNGGAITTALGVPIVRITPRTEPAARAVLFTIGTTKYTVDPDPPANSGLMYLHIASGQPCDPDFPCAEEHGRGELAANDYILGKLLGAEGYKALRECEDLTTADLGTIVTIVVRLALGTLETPKEPAPG
jgi:hypothetical protein